MGDRPLLNRYISCPAPLCTRCTVTTSSRPAGRAGLGAASTQSRDNIDLFGPVHLSTVSVHIKSTPRSPPDTDAKPQATSLRRAGYSMENPNKKNADGVRETTPTRTGMPRGRAFGAASGAVAECATPWILAYVSVIDAVRFSETSWTARLAVEHHYATTTALTMEVAPSYADEGAARQWRVTAPLPGRVCARLRTLTVRHGEPYAIPYDSKTTVYDMLPDTLSRARQVHLESTVLAALLSRNRHTLTSVHLCRSPDGVVGRALRGCGALVTLGGAFHLSAALLEGESTTTATTATAATAATATAAAASWPRLKILPLLQDKRGLKECRGLALTDVGPIVVGFCSDVLMLARHPLRVLSCTLQQEKAPLLALLHDPPDGTFAATAEELLRLVRVPPSDDPSLGWWNKGPEEEGEEEAEADDTEAVAAASSAIDAPALASHIRALHASLTALDIGCNRWWYGPAHPLDASVDLPAGVWRLAARDDMLRYIRSARGLRALSTHAATDAQRATLERVLRSIGKPNEFNVLELVCAAADNGAADWVKEGSRVPRITGALLSASALVRSLRVLIVHLTADAKAACVARLAKARAWPELRSLHLLTTAYPHQDRLFFRATPTGHERNALDIGVDLDVALAAWPALVCFGGACLSDCRAHFEDNRQWLADPDHDACVARYLARLAAGTNDGTAGGSPRAPAAHLKFLQLGLGNCLMPVRPSLARFPALRHVALGVANVSTATVLAALAPLMGNAPRLERIDIDINEGMDDHQALFEAVVAHTALLSPQLVRVITVRDHTDKAIATTFPRREFVRILRGSR